MLALPKTLLLCYPARLNPSRISYSLFSQMAWACKRCTFLNPPSQQSTCQICFSSESSSLPSSSSSSLASTPKWSCKACTFLNPYNTSNCEVCDTRAHISSFSSFEDLNDTGPDSELDSSVGSVFLPLQPCKRMKVSEPVQVDPDSAHLGGFQSVKASEKGATLSEEAGSGTAPSTLKILSYNVWFREDLELQKRMKALGDLIELHSPEVICFQELSKLPVKSFSCKPFSNSVMGRELCVAEIEIQKDKSLVIATSHLESPCPAPPTWNQMYSKERVEQATEAINFLETNQNVVFGGDMNWDDKSDGLFPLPDGWLDAWAKLRPEENGFTYDTKSNQMLTGNRTLQKRLDRFVCKLRDFKIHGIEMIGKDAIPGVSYIKEKKVKKEIKKLELPVLPSDHYGLLLTICSQ